MKDDRCEPPTPETLARTFDIDMYDCPCGHPYGAHEYEHTQDGRRMLINRCTVCDAEALTSRKV